MHPGLRFIEHNGRYSRTVDMYYFPNAVDGTAFAAMELIDYENKGPIPNRNGMYELAAFTKHRINKYLTVKACVTLLKSCLVLFKWLQCRDKLPGYIVYFE